MSDHAPPLLPGPRPAHCLDFVNTLAWRGRERPEESLREAGDLLGWLVGAGLPAGAAEALGRWIHRDPAGGAALLRDALALRESLARLLGALAGGRVGAEADLAALNAALEGAPPRRRLARLGEGHGWEVPLAEAPSVPWLLAPVLWSAADLLAGEEHRRLRACANEECRWLFLDESRNGTRRWCDMNACGNRAKARRHYERTKAR